MLRTIYEVLPVPLVITRLYDGLILYANSELLQIFACDLEDLINHPISDLYYNSSERKAILARLNQDELVQNDELLLKKKDGSCFWAIA